MAITRGDLLDERKRRYAVEEQRDKLLALLNSGTWRTEYSCNVMDDWRAEVPRCAGEHEVFFRRVWTGIEHSYDGEPVGDAPTSPPDPGRKTTGPPSARR